MRVLIVGASGQVGRAALAALSGRHEIVTAGRSSGDLRVDVLDQKSVVAMYDRLGRVDAVVACSGHTHFGPVDRMTPADFMKGISDKLMGQINLVLLGLDNVADQGSFTLTGGVTDRDPIRSGSNSAAVNGALGGFAFSAALEMPRGIRINVVSPGLLEESAARYDGFFPGHLPVPSSLVGLAYVKCVEGALTGKVIPVD
jgi:NAD(P)-dependent dehydrogenase (short-subunit alcohol dehydrogenase family)